MIKEEVLGKVEITAEELIIDIGTHLCDTGRLSMAQARNLSQFDHISFQKELTKKDVYIKYGIDDLETDLENIKRLKERNQTRIIQ